VKPLVWTIRVAGDPERCVYVPHRGTPTAAVVEQMVQRAKAAGLTVVVKLTSRRRAA